MTENMKKEKPVKIEEGRREHLGTWSYKGVTVRAEKEWRRPTDTGKGSYHTYSFLWFTEESGETFSLDSHIYGGIRNAVKIIDRAESTGELVEHRGRTPIKVARNGDNWEKID